MKLYIAGPMTGHEDHNFPAFNEAEYSLRVAGFEVENPADQGVIDGWAWSQYLKHDLPLMLQCDGVATLLGWTTSRGAKLEVHVARELGMDVRMVDQWLRLRAEELAI